MLVPAAAIADWNRAVVPTRGAEILPQLGSCLFRCRPDDHRETAVLVLFPVPVGREGKHACHALLALQQSLVQILWAFCFPMLVQGHGAFLRYGAALGRGILAMTPLNVCLPSRGVHPNNRKMRAMTL